MEQATLDLALPEGVKTYIGTMLCSDARKAFAMHGTVAPFGVALGTVVNGTKLPRPRAMPIGALGMSLRNVKRSLRALARNSAAQGAILVYVGEFARRGSDTGITTRVLVVQLEHATMGDVVWAAPMRNASVDPFTEVKLENCEFDIPRTALLPGRWMD